MTQFLFTLILPTILLVILLIWYRKQTAIWEPFIPFAAVGLFIIAFYYWGVESVTKDTEYYGNYITETRYYEPWNEYIHQTCTRTVGSGKNAHTETYDCSYVRYHSAEYIVILNDESEHSISEEYYDQLVSKFGTGKHFVDMNRNYYTEDGDMYFTDYNNSYATFEPYYREHSYTNKIQASSSVFNFPDVKDEDAVKYKLFKYPEIEESNNFPAILSHGYKVPDSAIKKFDYINGQLGLKKQVRVWILLFNANERKLFYLQRGYWKNGNKNEFIVCLGMNKDGSVAWYEPMGWSENKLIEIETRDYVLNEKQLDLTKFGDFMYNQVIKNWTRTSFDKFDYINVEPPLWSIIVCWIVSLIACIGLFIWITTNEFDFENHKYSNRW